MRQALRVLHQVEHLALEAVMVRDEQEAHKFFSRPHVVDAQLGVDREFLRDLTEAIAQEAVDVLKLVLVGAAGVREVRLASRDTVLVRDTVTQIGERVVQNDRWPDVRC